MCPPLPIPDYSRRFLADLLILAGWHLSHPVAELFPIYHKFTNKKYLYINSFFFNNPSGKPCYRDGILNGIFDGISVAFIILSSLAIVASKSRVPFVYLPMILFTCIITTLSSGG